MESCPSAKLLSARNRRITRYGSIYVKKEVVSETMQDDGLPEKGKKYIFVGTAQPDGSILLESLYAKTEYNDDNYQRFLDYVAKETSVDRERFISSFEIGSD